MSRNNRNSNQTTEVAPQPAAAGPNGDQHPLSKPIREMVPVMDDSDLSNLFDTAKFDQMQRVAGAMAASSLLPEHLRGDKNLTPDQRYRQAQANCLRVLNQSYRWGVDPFAVLDTTYVVHGKLGYEGKLVAAIVNSKCGFNGGLHYVYNSKQGDDFACVCYASEFKIAADAFDLLMRYAEEEDRAALSQLEAKGVLAVRLSFQQGKTFDTNGKLQGAWSKDPEQKIGYSAALKWARRHRPEIIMGVLTDDDLDRMQPAAAIGDDSATRQPARSIADLTERLKPQAGVIDSPATEPSVAADEPKPTQEQGGGNVSKGGEATEPAKSDAKATESTSSTAQTETAARQVNEPPARLEALQGFISDLAGATNMAATEGVYRQHFPEGHKRPAAENDLARQWVEYHRQNHLPPSDDAKMFLGRIDKVATGLGLNRLLAELAENRDKRWTVADMRAFKAAGEARAKRGFDQQGQGQLPIK